MKGLSIVIVNYWSVDLILQCIGHFLHADYDFPYEVIISDNGSNSDDQTRVKKIYPTIIWISNEYNVGFGKANNRAFKIAQYETILLLNPDSIIDSNKLIDLYHRFNHDKDEPAIAGVQLIDSNGKNSNSFYSEYASFRQILRQNLIIDKLRILPPPLETVKAVHGSCMILSKSMLQEDIFFDEDFFLYAEEIELCHRAIKRGFCISFYSDIQVLHIGEATQSNKLKTNTQRNISNCLLFLKARGTLGVILFFWLNCLNFSSNFFLLPFMDKSYKKDYWLSFKAYFGATKYYMNVLFNSYSKPLRYNTNK